MEDIVQNKRNLYIIGAGGFGRELESYLYSVDEKDRDWELKGYIDDNPRSLENYPSNLKVLGCVDNFDFEDSDYVIIAIAAPETKRKIYKLLKNRVTFFTYIDSSAKIGKFVNIEEGCVICPNCIVTTNVSLGKCTILNIGTQIGHDTRIDDFCSFMPNVDIGGESNIGRSVYMGTNSTIINLVEVCSDVIIGAGAIVVRHIKNEGTFVGNPARKIK